MALSQATKAWNVAVGRPRLVAFVLVPRFSMIAFTSAVEPLRIANRLSGIELYRWVILSPDGEPARASNGIVVNVNAAISAYDPEVNRDRPELVLVCGGLGSERYKDPALYAWLRRNDRQGAVIGSLCTGTSVLAAADLLDGYKCVIHWESLPGFVETFPDIDVSVDLFAVDRDRLTCAGGTAALDMMLYLIAEHHGNALATKISEQCLADRLRAGDYSQQQSPSRRLRIHSRKVLQAIEMMEAHIETPVSQDNLAKYLGLSRRQLERLFHKHVGMPPSRYSLEIRLRRARDLLMQTDMTILEIAMACGFVSASHFSKCYRSLYAKSPREERQMELQPVA